MLLPPGESNCAGWRWFGRLHTSEVKAEMAENPVSEVREEENGLYFGDIIKLDVLLVDFWKGFKKFWWLAALIIAALSCFAFYNCKKSYVPKYISQASFSISTVNSSQGSVGAGSFSSYYNSVLAEQLSKTFSYIINSQTMKQILMNKLGVNGLNGSITAKNDVASTPLFTISVTSTSPRDAYDILCAVIENYPRLAQYVLGETQMSVYSPAQLPQAPYNKFSYKRDVAVAAAAGILISCLIFLAYAFSRSTIKKRDDIREKLNLRCIGEVPWVEAKKRSRRAPSLVTISPNNADFSEAFRYLKRRVLKCLDADNKKILAVTSAVPGEGKTTVSYNLALAFARSGKKVALVDTDFARRSIQKYLGATLLSRGLSDYINGDCSLGDIATGTSLENFKIYYAGTKPVKNIPREALIRLFDHLRERYDYVILDAAPCGVVSDSARIIDMADETLFVIKQDSASVSKIRRSLQYVYDLNATVAGAVFNAVRTGLDGYSGSGYYSYGYYGKKYGYYGKKYGYYGRKYGYYGRKYGYYGGKTYGYGKYGDYGFGYNGYGYSGGKRVTENVTDKREETAEDEQ